MSSGREALTGAELDRLRQQVQDLTNGEEWAGILALEPKLRQDTEYWIDIWAVFLAVAARRVGDPRARGFLDEAIAGGFFQPEITEGLLEQSFQVDPDWPALSAAIAANLPPPGLELVAWPELSLAHPVRLDEIVPERADALRARLPAPAPSAWDTARELLRWVSGAWQHAMFDHVEWRDAVHVLDRVAAGERFACKEYTIVLSQALNACGIPARSVAALRANHHTGVGKGHAISEAWIDDLGRWVVLDGQNGMYWADADGRPLGVVELRDRVRAGEPPARVVSLAGKASAQAEIWWPHFHTVSPTGVMFSPAPYAPIFDKTYVPPFDQLRGDPAGSHPDLLELAVGIAEVDSQPAIQPVTRHLHARGFEAALGGERWRLPLAGQPWPIPTDTPGEHTATIATVTDYGTHRSHPVRYVVR